MDYSPQARRAGIRVQRPARDAFQSKLAKNLGGSTADHEDLMMSVWMLVHGAAMLLISKSIEPKDAEPARAAFTFSVGVLLKHGTQLHRR
jgi:hypothetical protein